MSEGKIKLRKKSKDPRPQADDKTEKKFPFNEILMVNHKFYHSFLLCRFVFTNTQEWQHENGPFERVKNLRFF